MITTILSPDETQLIIHIDSQDDYENLKPLNIKQQSPILKQLGLSEKAIKKLKNVAIAGPTQRCWIASPQWKLFPVPDPTPAVPEWRR